MSETRVGLAMTGSFCTFRAVLAQVEILKNLGYALTPVLSRAASDTDSRFMRAEELKSELRRLTGKEPLTTLCEVEPIGPKKLLDIYVIAPATGASLGKMACGIFDTPALLGAKSHLRNGRPLLLAPSTNDGLGAAAASIGKLLNQKNVFFVPFGQDDPAGKPRSLVSRFELLPDALAAALAGAQIQPMLR